MKRSNRSRRAWPARGARRRRRNRAGSGPARPGRSSSARQPRGRAGEALVCQHAFSVAIRSGAVSTRVPSRSKTMVAPSRAVRSAVMRCAFAPAPSRRGKDAPSSNEEADVTDPSSRPRAAVILAAGQGTRMRSPTAQGAAQGRRPRHARPRHRRRRRRSAASGSWWWSAPHSPAVRRARGAAAGRGRGRRAGPAARHRPRGAGAREARSPGFEGDVLVTYADVPLLDAEPIAPLFDAARRRGRSRACWASKPPTPAPTAG